ncbi:DUF2924 domain-containing protein [Mesorhizobium sp. M0016]|uniref:DUF2924 domain-containing protein n=1 Tax=Mesorhizobium sp. M0016 TaxID=2956843 RepID=UPI003334D165
MAILNTTTAKADNTEAGETAASLDNSTPTRKLREKSGVTVSVIVKKAKDEAPVTPTKTDIVLKKLKSAKGVTIQVLRDATGWQAHSVRGFLSGTIKRGLLERSAAWHLQAKRLGGLPSTVKKILGTGNARRINVNAIQPGNTGSDWDGVPSVRPGSSDKVEASPPRSIPPKAGSRLMREWNGRMHIVEVVDDGFVLDGKTYGSLSAVARRITGAHWSGPRFFSL